MPNVPRAPEGASSACLGALPEVDHLAAGDERRARRWLVDLTAGCLEHELSAEQVVAAVDALHPGGWSAFVADETGYFEVLALVDEDSGVAGGGDWCGEVCS